MDGVKKTLDLNKVVVLKPKPGFNQDVFPVQTKPKLYRNALSHHETDEMYFVDGCRSHRQTMLSCILKKKSENCHFRGQTTYFVV